MSASGAFFRHVHRSFRGLAPWIVYFLGPILGRWGDVLNEKSEIQYIISILLALLHVNLIEVVAQVDDGLEAVLIGALVDEHTAPGQVVAMAPVGTIIGFMLTFGLKFLFLSSCVRTER